MNTTIYLIRHSIKYSDNIILNYHTDQSDRLKREKIILTPLGEEKAKILSTEDELKNIDVVYASNMVRTLQTAKYLLESQDLKINIDDRLDERRLGIFNSDKILNWFELQYENINYHTEGGESQLDVRNRMTDAIDEILEKNRGKRVAIFSHGYAITFYLLKWCKLISVSNTHHLKIGYKDKIIVDKILDAPEVFKIVMDQNNNPVSIELIEFDDLKNIK